MNRTKKGMNRAGKSGNQYPGRNSRERKKQNERLEEDSQHNGSHELSTVGYFLVALGVCVCAFFSFCLYVYSLIAISAN